MTIGKQEAASAVDKLPMMGMRMPETCWAVFKRQAKSWESDASGLLVYLNHKLLSAEDIEENANISFEARVS